MITKVKALIWEECRVGGVIALTCIALDALIMYSYRYQLNADTAGGIEPLGYLVMALGVPILMGVLMTMNPNHKGYLSGGYPERILQLPIPTYLPVAVSLATRLLFVVVATMSIVFISKVFFSDGFAYELVIVATLIFLLVQLIDWLRGPLSGLTSFVGLAGLAVAAYILVFSSSNNVLRLFTVWIMEPLGNGIGPALVACLLLSACIFLVAIVAVGAARKGRKYGVPEIWTWHKIFGSGFAGRIAPFESPLTARVWVEFRRSGFILPIVTGTLCVAFYIGLRLYLGEPNEATEGRRVYLFSMLPLIAMVIGAFSHAIKTNILPFRRHKGMSGYTFLQPDTTEQITYARVISDSIQFGVTMIVVMFLHFNLSGTGFFLVAVPEALAMGTTSLREVFWIVLGRTIAFGLVTWVLMAASTRLILLNVLLFPVIGGVAYFGRGLAVLGGSWMRFNEVLTIAVSALLIFTCLVVFVLLFRKNILSKRSLVFWIGIWIACTGLIAIRAVASFDAVSIPFIWQAAMVFVSFGIASLVPLPFLAAALDVHKKRHSASPAQNPIKVAKTIRWNQFGTAEKVGSAILGTVVVIAVATGWPGRPAYQKLWKDNGRVSSITELDAVVMTVPQEENAASKYRQFAQKSNDASTAFFNDYIVRNGGGNGNGWHDDFENILVYGAVSIERAQPIDVEVRRLSSLYWSNVSSKIAPHIIETTEAFPISRLPVSYANDFGGDAFMQYLSETRAISRDLKLDALSWAMQNEPAKAVDSILATFRLAEAVGQEPTLMAQLVRMAITRTGLSALEETLNCISLPAIELERIQKNLDSFRAENRMEMQFKKALVGESVINMGYSPMQQRLIMNKGRYSMVVSAPWNGLVYSGEAEHLLIATAYENLFRYSANSFEEFETQMEQEEQSFQYAHVAPTAGILFGGTIFKSYEAVLRIQTQLDVARVALAADRFRLANDRYPNSLEELVPDYMSEIPRDFFASDEIPPNALSGERPSLRYRTRDNEFVVYSISMNQRDDFGIDEIKNWYRDGDITFTISTIKANSLEPPASATD
jgi:hypothetical protein